MRKLLFISFLFLGVDFTFAQCDWQIQYESSLCSGSMEAQASIEFYIEGPNNGDGEWNIGNGLLIELVSSDVEDYSLNYTFQESGMYSIHFSFIDDEGACINGDTTFIEVLEASLPVNYIPDYFANNPSWCSLQENNLCENGYCNSSYYDYISGDTLFNDVSYKILSTNRSDYYEIDTIQYSYLNMYLRQEGEVIYRYYPYEELEIVLYDFTIDQFLDTLPPGGLYPEPELGGQIFPEGNGVYLVMGLDSICFEGNYIKRIWFDSFFSDLSAPFWILEGIGHEFGPFIPFTQNSVIYFQELIFYMQDGDVLHGYNNNDCEGLLLNLNSRSNIQFSIHPNPANSFITLKIVDLHPFSYEIFNLEGKILKSEINNIDQTEIDISSLSEGMYLIRIEDDQGNSAIKKWIKQ